LVPGKRIFIDDGLISIVATEIGSNFVIGEVENAGFLGSKKGCNLPGTDIGLPGLKKQKKKPSEIRQNITENMRRS
jgi:pyruvate kinase